MANLEFRYYDTVEKYNARLHSGMRFQSDYNINIHTIRRCAVVVGRNPWDAKDPIEVLKWRLALINSFVDFLPSGEINIKNIEYLETTEKGSVGYMLGMIFAQVFAQELLGIRQLLHLTSDEVIVQTGGKSPDLCGYNKAKNRAYLLEAKGSTLLSNKIDNRTIKTAHIQLDSISQVEFTRIKSKFNGNSLTKYIIGTHPNRDGKFEQEIIDPNEEEKNSIIIDCDLMILKHYYNVYLIIKSNIEEHFIHHGEFIVVNFKDHNLNIGMLKNVYDYLDPIYEEVSNDILEYANNPNDRNHNDIYTEINTMIDNWNVGNENYFDKNNLNLIERRLDNSNNKNNGVSENVNKKYEVLNEQISIGIDGICAF